MKKTLTLLFLLILAAFSVKQADAITFEEAMSQSKPVVLLIHAPWAANVDAVKQAYDAMSVQYGDRYNFTKIDIATKEAQGFNQKYTIYPNLPYVLLFKDNGKFSRYLKQDCVMDEACFKERLDFFLK